MMTGSPNQHIIPACFATPFVQLCASRLSQCNIQTHVSQQQLACFAHVVCYSVPAATGALLAWALARVFMLVCCVRCAVFAVLAPRPTTSQHSRHVTAPVLSCGACSACSAAGHSALATEGMAYAPLGQSVNNTMVEHRLLLLRYLLCWRSSQACCYYVVTTTALPAAPAIGHQLAKVTDGYCLAAGAHCAATLRACMRAGVGVLHACSREFLSLCLLLFVSCLSLVPACHSLHVCLAATPASERCLAGSS
jgi:hypothetical protein